MTDYLQFFRADGPVFLGPVPGERLFVAPALAPGLERLALFCRQNDGLVLITGEPGVGKTTLLKWLAAQLDPDTHELLLTTMVQREHGAGWLTPRLAEHMGLGAAAGLDLAGLIRATAAQMDDLISEQRKLLVAVDAAHLAETPAALDELAAFLGLQALAGGCLTFVLAGDPALAATLAATPALAPRLAYALTVPPLDAAATGSYLDHRARAAGFASPFDEDGVAAVFAATRGIPAAIDGLAENCLVEASARATRRVTGDIVREAMRHVGVGGTLSAPAPVAPSVRPPAPPPSSLTAALPFVPGTGAAPPRSTPGSTSAPPTGSTSSTPSGAASNTSAAPAGSTSSTPSSAASNTSAAPASTTSPGTAPPRGAKAPPPPPTGPGTSLTSLFKTEPGRRKP